jgi:hypothetical protein
LYEKNEKTASTEMDFIQKLRDILPSLDRRFKDESPIFSMRINMIHKILEVLRFLTSKMVKIVISYLFTGHYFPTEITNCTIFELNRLIRCQTQEKKPKNVLVSQVTTL